MSLFIALFTIPSLGCKLHESRNLSASMRCPKYDQQGQAYSRHETNGKCQMGAEVTFSSFTEMSLEVGGYGAWGNSRTPLRKCREILF